MLMRGTSKHTRQQLQEELDRLKARMNPIGNATSTRFSIEATRENLPAVMRLLAEVLREPNFPDNEFEQLKQSSLARAEQMRSDPTPLAQLTLRSHLSQYPAGDVRHVSLPDEEIADTKATTLEDVKKFYKDFLGASTAELSLVGDFDAGEMKQLATELFGDWKSSSKYARVPYVYKPAAVITKSIDTPDKANATFAAGVPLKISEKHPDYPALTFANYMFGAGSSSRLFNRIRKTEGLSYGVMSMVTSHPVFEDGSFLAMAIAAPQNVPKVEATFKEELAKALKDGFTEQEIAEAKKGWLQEKSMSRSQDSSLVSILAENEFENRTLAYQQDLENKVSALTGQQIIDAMRRHIDPEKISYFKAGDFKKARYRHALSQAQKFGSTSTLPCKIGVEP